MTPSVRLITGCGIAVAVLAGACEEPGRPLHDGIRQHSVLLSRPGGRTAESVWAEDDAPATAVDATLQAGELTLARARLVALSANPDVDAALDRLASALARVGEAESFYFPTLTAGGSSRRTFQVPFSQSRLSRDLFPAAAGVGTDFQLTIDSLLDLLSSRLLGQPPASFFEQNSFSTQAMNLTATWTVFDGFIREARVLSAKFSRRASEMALADVERLIIQATDSAYHQTQLAEERRRIALADEEFSLNQLVEARKRLDNGRATQGDVLNFETRAALARAAVVAAEGMVESGRIMLAELMGVPDVRLPDGVTLSALSEETGGDLAAPNADEWLALALDRRPDLAGQSLKLESRRQDVRIARGQFSPAVTVGGSYGFERLSNFALSEEDQASALGVEVAWQLFTGGLRTSTLRRAQSQEAEAQAELRRKRLEVIADVRDAAVAVVTAQEEMVAQRKALESARESRRVVEAEYAEGRASISRLNEAQRDLVEADAGLARARIRLRQAWSDLAAAAGAYGTEWNHVAE